MWRKGLLKAYDIMQKSCHHLATCQQQMISNKHTLQNNNNLANATSASAGKNKWVEEKDGKTAMVCFTYVIGYWKTFRSVTHTTWEQHSEEFLPYAETSLTERKTWPRTGCISSLQLLQRRQGWNQLLPKMIILSRTANLYLNYNLTIFVGYYASSNNYSDTN